MRSRSARRPLTNALTMLLTYLESPSQTGRETLGLRPALRQAAPGRRRGRGRGGARATRQRSVAQQAPSGTPAEFVLHSLNYWGRGLPPRHALRARRLPLDVIRNTPLLLRTSVHPRLLHRPVQSTLRNPVLANNADSKYESIRQLLLRMKCHGFLGARLPWSTRSSPSCSACRW
jgi:hypothetical protein